MRTVRCPECGTVHEVPPQRPAAVCVCRFSLPADDPRCFQLLELPVEQCAAVVSHSPEVVELADDRITIGAVDEEAAG